MVMFSFVVFVDTMLSAVFYFSCLSYSMEAVELGPLWNCVSRFVSPLRMSFSSVLSFVKNTISLAAHSWEMLTY